MSTLRTLATARICRSRTSPEAPPQPDRPKTDIEEVLAAGARGSPVRRRPRMSARRGVPPVTRDPNARRYDPENPAKAYKFELDTFQRKSVEVMERARA